MASLASDPMKLSLLCPLCLGLGAWSCSSVPVSSGPAGVPAVPSYGDVSRHLALYYGERELDEDDFEPVDELDTYGLAFSWVPESGGLGGEVGVFLSSADESVGGVDLDVETIELFGGVRHTFGGEALRPYLAGGISFLQADVEGSVGPFEVEEDDDTFGLYVSAGLLAFVTPEVTLGAEYRLLLGTDVEFFEEEGDADYGQLAVTLGVGF